MTWRLPDPDTDTVVVICWTVAMAAKLGPVTLDSHVVRCDDCSTPIWVAEDTLQRSERNTPNQPKALVCHKCAAARFKDVDEPPTLYCPPEYMELMRDLWPGPIVEAP